jgi:hypothetical protein
MRSGTPPPGGTPTPVWRRKKSRIHGGEFCDRAGSLTSVGLPTVGALVLIPSRYPTVTPNAPIAS